MKEEEMKARLARGDDPLELSILKWQDVAYHGGEDGGMANCALCKVHYDEEGSCSDKCPVRKNTGVCGCNKTPYEEWDYHQDKEHIGELDRTVHCEKCKEIAIRELEFLKSLREKDD